MDEAQKLFAGSCVLGVVLLAASVWLRRIDGRATAERMATLITELRRNREATHRAEDEARAARVAAEDSRAALRARSEGRKSWTSEG